MPIHVAITRRVLPDREVEFRDALREFFQASFDHGSVLGASMIIPLPDSGSREFGILRSFTSEAEMDSFYASPIFKTWEERARTMTEGEPDYRRLHGLDAWFRSLDSPPRWKMAVCTLVGVFPTSTLLGKTLEPVTRSLPFPANALVFSVLMVAMLTWVVMPLLTRLLHPWLHPKKTF